MLFIEDEFEEDVDVYYNTRTFNSVLKHGQNPVNILKARASIIDLTYVGLDEILGLAADVESCIDAGKPANIIYVGSFDKMFGAGLRLGFAFYTDQYAESMAIQRENYIN